MGSIIGSIVARGSSRDSCGYVNVNCHLIGAYLL